MAATVSWDTLRELASFRAPRGCAISLYLDLDPSVAPTQGDVVSRVNAIVSEGERVGGARGDLGHEQRQGLKADLERIRGYFDEEFDRQGVHGVAVFASGLDNLWEVVPLGEPVADAIKVSDELYLAPLVRMVGRGDGVLVAVVSRERGQIFALRGGRLEEIVDESEEQPGRHDQGGWSQARFQRHIDELAAEHMRRVADALDRQVRRRRGSSVLVFCPEPMRGDFEGILSTAVRETLLGWAQAEAHASPSELLEVAKPMFAERRESLETEALERWREEAGRNGRAAAGWESVLEAASDGRVEVLLFQDGANRAAFRCPSCGRASMRNGNCPLDGTRMEPRDEGLELAVHQTLSHGGTVHAVEHRRDLDPVEGIGALLRF